jgi:hypothetical protein
MLRLPPPPLLPLLLLLLPPRLAAAAATSFCRSWAAACPAGVAAASTSRVTERSAGVTCDTPSDVRCRDGVARVLSCVPSRKPAAINFNTHTQTQAR